MFDQLDALRALRSTGTMGRAAAMLRVTQSAVSKRIAALETGVGARLVERDGRRVRLTAEGERLLAEAMPLLEQLREVTRPRIGAREEILRIAATDSLLASWLPATLRAALDSAPGLRIELHAHRGPTLLERVRSGDYTLGICPMAVGEAELGIRPLGEEPMAVVPSGLRPIQPGPTLPVWAIETRSLTWEAVSPRLGRLAAKWGFTLEVQGRLESFAALVQVARAGFAHALVPVGVARGLGVPADRLVPLPGLARPIVAIGRRTSFDRPGVQSLLAGLDAVWPEL